ncbi:MAG: NAD(P)/FAD-dependent oxidoreductase, partial [Halioglobus sp.]|nr:NAD(P)/FAD-dependent oxidoreductase [Halioglobus sp.]
MDLISELDASDQVLLRRTRTGMFYSGSLFRLSTPLDLLRFSALGFADRIRLGVLALRACSVRDWRSLEALTAAQWLRGMAGDRVYRVVWEPLLRSKFGEFADDVSAVWMWNKLKLRGGSRGADGAETLAYFRGGFPALAQRLQREIERLGGSVLTGVAAEGLRCETGGVRAVATAAGEIPADAVIATPALPLVARLLQGHVAAPYVEALSRVRYLANVCLVMEMDRSLSETYWLNVNDPGFPFVGVVEHTNFEPAAHYGGRHIAYLSRYLPETDPMYSLPADEVMAFCLPHLQRIFPAFQADWVLQHHVWRARYAQPVVTRDYPRTIPDMQTPLRGVYIASMAQIYPEDRGTNYAVRSGQRVADVVTGFLSRDR